MKDAIIDSNVWIALKHKSDQYNEKAERIVKAWQNKEIRQVYITNYILLETANFLLRKASFEIALDAIKMLTESARIKVRYVDGVMHIRVMQLFQMYKGMSMADCSLLALAEEENIKGVYSFDLAFDKVKHVIRKENA